MITLERVRKNLDTQLLQTQQNVNNTAKNMDGLSIADWHMFNRHMRQYSSSIWAANQEVTLKHNLARLIINDIR